MEVLLSEEFSLMKNKFTLGAFIRADKPTAHIFRKTQRVSFLTSTRRQLRQRQRSLADICLSPTVMTFVVSISSQNFVNVIVDHIRDEEQSTSAHFIKISYDDTLKDETLTMTLNVYV